MAVSGSRMTTNDEDHRRPPRGDAEGDHRTRSVSRYIHHAPVASSTSAVAIVAHPRLVPKRNSTAAGCTPDITTPNTHGGATSNTAEARAWEDSDRASAATSRSIRHRRSDPVQRTGQFAAHACAGVGHQRESGELWGPPIGGPPPEHVGDRLACVEPGRHPCRVGTERTARRVGPLEDRRSHRSSPAQLTRHGLDEPRQRLVEPPAVREPVRHATGPSADRSDRFRGGGAPEPPTTRRCRSVRHGCRR